MYRPRNIHYNSGAGTWRGLNVAVKTVIFQGANMDSDSMRRATTEASIAYNLAHPNIVATYSHELKSIVDTSHVEELNTWKLYLIQVLKFNRDIQSHCLVNLA